MLNRRFLVSFALAVAVVAPAAAADGPFRDLALDSIQNLPARGGSWETPLPRHFRALEVDVKALETLLDRAPAERSPAAAVSPLVIALPYPDGTDRRFRVEESSILEPALAAKFPEIHTYIAQGIDDPTATARLSLTSLGFHAMVLSTAGTVYIDPYRKWDARYALSYFKNDAQRAAGPPFHCDVKDETAGESGASRVPPVSLPAAASGTNLRTYRLALAADAEYSTAVCAPNPAAVACAMNAMAVSMNRVNGIYEREVAIRMVLIANDNLIVYTDVANEPYTDSNPGAIMLSQNQSNIDSVIGSANYDIGHVFSTGGGGVANLRVPCMNGSKAHGVTGRSDPTGDGFDVDYVAHEMGHQFGGNHSFNGTSGSCSGNRNASTAYEPGSGSTIMAYAGICAADDLQPHSDDTFQTKNFDEIVTFATGLGNSCAVVTATGNTPPVVNAGPSFTIPRVTPFTLTGSATDADSDSLTYMWEEFDLGAAAPPNDDILAIRPIFRSFAPLTVPSRTFPRLADILVNVPSFGESMSNRNRTMVFRLTARDNRVGGGGVNYASTTVTITDTAGPFVVTQPNSTVIWSGNSTQTVTWNVANTTAAPVSCANVEIDLSTDGGNTFSTVLLASTPNDGIERVPVPNTPTGLGRIRVSCVGNIFFDISDNNFSINPDDGLPSPTLSSISPTSGPISGGTVVTLTGTNFVNGATVYFGLAQATSVTFNSATSLTATTSTYSPGTADVTVINPDAKTAFLNGAFQFFDHSGMLIFKDGFESGDTALWSGIAP